MAKPKANAATYRQACYDLALQEQPRVIVEVGVYAGDLSRLLASIPSVERLWLVDHWREPAFVRRFGKEHMDTMAARVIAWADTMPTVQVLQMASAKAARQFADSSICFWETDGDHSIEGITSDLRAWMPKVRSGGIVCGDNFEMPSVATVVNHFLPERQLAAGGRFWWSKV
jgi:Methyltransferase domain